MATETLTDLRNSVAMLNRSRTGRDAMRGLLAWLDESGMDLDGRNQQAVLNLLAGAWGAYAGTARDLMREATGQ